MIKELSARLRLIDSLTAPAKRAAQSIDQMSRAAKAVDSSMKNIDNAMNGATRATNTYRDAQGRLRSSNGRFVQENTAVARSFKSVASSIDSVSSRMGKIGGKMWGGISSAVTAPFSAMTSLPGMAAGGAAVYFGGFKPLQLAGEMEQANIAFETMLGSADKAKKMLTDLQNFANATPFEFPELRDDAKMLLAFKFQASQIIPMMTSIGNASSGLGLGAEGINRIILALGQMKAKGRVQGDEMMQLTEAGINAWDILAKSIGVSTAEVMKMSEQGLIPADNAIQAIITGMNEQFPNMMAKQSKSLFGLWSTIKDTFDSKILLRWGQGLSSATEPRLKKVVDWLDKNDASVKRWGDVLQSTASQASNWILTKFEDAYNYIDNHYINNPAFTKLDFSAKVGFIFDDVYASFTKWVSNGGQDKMNQVGTSIGTTLNSVLNAAQPAMVTTASAVGSAIGEALVIAIGNAIKGAAYDPNNAHDKNGIWSNLWDRIKSDAPSSFKYLIPGSDQRTGDVIPAGSKPINNVVGTGGKVMMHANGGIQTRPHIGVVAEAGPEAIVPLTNPRRGREVLSQAANHLGVGSGGNTYNISLNYQGSSRFTREDAREMLSLIADEVHQAGQNM